MTITVFISDFDGQRKIEFEFWVDAMRFADERAAELGVTWERDVDGDIVIDGTTPALRGRRL